MAELLTKMACRQMRNQWYIADFLSNLFMACSQLNDPPANVEHSEEMFFVQEPMPAAKHPANDWHESFGDCAVSQSWLFLQPHPQRHCARGSP